MQLFRRTPRPRLLGERRPVYSPEASSCFVSLGAAAGRAVYAFTDEDRDEAIRDLGRAFRICKLYANDTLLEIARHYCLVVQAYTCGNADRSYVDTAQHEFYAACREALGTED